MNSINNLKTFHVDVDLAAYPDADFRNIQDAVNNASAYDSVIVHNGTYRETVTMDKVLSLVGEGRPTIDAKYNAKYVIGISVDDCVVKGFKCVNAKGRSEAGIIVDSKRNVIVENVCESNNLAILMVNASDNENAIDGLHGIWIDGSNNSITENEIMNCTRCGITLDGDNSTIENNTIVDCEEAIYLDGFNLRIPCGLPQGDLVKYIKKNFRCCEAASHWRNTLWSCHRDSQGEGNFLFPKHTAEKGKPEEGCPT